MENRIWTYNHRALVHFGPTIPGLAAILLYALLCELYIFCFTLVG